MSVRELSFRGVPFRISCRETHPQHSSFFTFEDENAVRERDWGVRPGDFVLDVGAGVSHSVYAP